MKMLISFFLLILSCATVPAQDKQNVPDSPAIIYKQIRRITPSATIYYADRIGAGVLQKHIIALNHSTVKTILKPYSNYIKLTKAERHYLVTQLKESIKSSWPDNLFPGSKRMPADSFLVHMDKINTETIGFIKAIEDKDSLTKYSNAFRGYSAVFTFTKPIYIRNHTIFLQYFNWYDGGGAESLYFYRKENNEWKKWILVSAGDW
jgi:hypothetical protein